jgi:hypothetical protein
MLFFPQSGVAFIHLLFDGTATLAGIPMIGREYPSLGFTLATIGTLIVLGFEQVAVMLISRIEVGNKELVPGVMPSKDLEKHDHDHHENPNPPVELQIVDSEHHTHEHSCDHTHAIGLIAGSDSFQVLVKAYMVLTQPVF